MPVNGTPRDTVIEVRDLVTGFGSQIVHDKLDLDVYRGEILGVVGGSGTGKSVLMRTILGLNPMRAGRISVFGHDRQSISRDDQRKIDRRMGVLFQDGALFSALTVAENIQVPLREHFDMPQALMDDIAALKIALVGLSEDAGSKYPSELSGGMRKRAGLARALALDPEIVFLDEPTAGLDPIGAARFDELILNLRDALGFTVFMVTHDLDSLHAICDRIAVLAEHKVIVHGEMKAMLSFDHPWVRDYFHGPRSRASGVEPVTQQGV